MINNKFSWLVGGNLLNITKISKETGLSRTTLTNIYHRRAEGIQFKTLNTLCNYLDCTPNDIFEFKRETPQTRTNTEKLNKQNLTNSRRRNNKRIKRTISRRRQNEKQIKRIVCETQRMEESQV